MISTTFQYLDHQNCILDTDELQIYGGQRQGILYSIWHGLPMDEVIEQAHRKKNSLLMQSPYRGIVVDLKTLELGLNNCLGKWLAMYLPMMVHNGLQCLAYVRPEQTMAEFWIRQEEMRHSPLLPIKGCQTREAAETWVADNLSW